MKQNKIVEFCKDFSRKKISLRQREEFTAYLFVLVPIIGFLIFSLASIGYSFYYAFTNFNPILGISKWVGFDNFVDLFQDPKFIDACINTVILLASIPIGVTLGLLLAVYLKKLAHGSMLLSLLYYLPAVTSAVAINVIFNYIFKGDFGILNEVLGINLYWISENDGGLVKIAIIIKNVWASIGSTMILYLSGLNNIPNEYYEAADVMGASKRQQLVNITIPMSNPTTFYVLVTGIIGGLQSYADSQILAQGVSGGRTIVYYIWTYGIGDNADYGLASAASVFLALIIIALSIIQFSRNKMFKKVR